MSDDALSLVERLRALAAAAAAASLEFRYDEAVARGNEALALVNLDPGSALTTWDERLAPLTPEVLAQAAAAATSVAICTFRQADYMTSLLVARLELQARQWLGDEVGAANAQLGLGWCYHAVGLYQQALANHFQALDALERLQPGEVAGPLNGVARAYLDLGRVDLALEYGQRALDHATTSPSGRRDLSIALRVLGQARQESGDLLGARDAFQASFDRSDAYGQRLAKLSLGQLATEERRWDEAHRHFADCLEGLSPERRELVQCEALLGLGRVHLARGEPEAALKPLGEAIARASASGSPVEAAAAHRVMSEAMAALGRWEEALHHFQTFHDLEDREARQLSDRRTQILELQLDVDRMRKDREIDRLRNVELARAYSDLSHLHQQLEAQAARLRQLTRTDELTGVANRRAFEEHLSDELLRARRLHRPLSLLMVDLDDFKLVNDTHTHVVGDAVLRTTAEALLDSTREIDLVARFGGEEFVVLLPETGVEGALSVAHKVLAAVASRALDSQGLVLTASVGCATLDELDDEISLLTRADSNLYEAKRRGKNRAEA